MPSRTYRSRHFKSNQISLNQIDQPSSVFRNLYVIDPFSQTKSDMLLA